MIACLLVPALALAAAQQAPPTQDADGEQEQRPELMNLSLEELMNVDVEITSVSKKSQSLASSAAAVYVLTNEDIRRSGATSIPEVLRLVPGLDVARFNSNGWAISSRGFNNQFSNKLLVLIDGRSVYTPLFSGVYWDVQDVPLEDIDRIEVIRGPGAAMWGANAVNGVINIITKPASKTVGGLVSVGAGTEELGFGTARYGFAFADNGFLRVWAKDANHGPMEDELHTGIDDDWRQGRAGLRGDWGFADADALTFTADAYRGSFDGPTLVHQTVPPLALTRNADGQVEGEHLLGRWTHTLSKDSEFSLQAYVDSYMREVADIRQRVTTGDLEFEHRFKPLSWNEVIWGVGYRHFDAGTNDTFDVQMGDSGQGNALYSAFVQDESKFLGDRLSFVVGTKYEHNDFTGSEWQPDVRASFQPIEHQTVWGAISRAVRTPSVVEESGLIRTDVQPTAPFPTVVQIQGNEDKPSEKLVAYELGYRVEPTSATSLDLATFYNVYHDLTTYEPGTPFFNGATFVQPITFDSLMDGKTAGAELSGEWKVSNDWKLHGAYTWLRLAMHRSGTSRDTTAVSNVEGSSPDQQVQLRSLLDLTRDVELDVALYYVDALPALDVPAYVRGDARIGWHVNARTSISFVVQGLLHNNDREFKPDFLAVPTGVQTGAYVKIDVRF